MKNGDAIRAMTDEELADLLNDRAYPIKVWEGLSAGAFESAYDAWLWWLRQEATTDG